MSLIQKKARPIKRDITSLRDDRLFIIACDDTYAPKQYFEFFSIPRIQVHVVETVDGTSSANHVINRLLQYKNNCEQDDELWMILDTDHYTSDNHIKTFMSAITRAKQNGVKIALSKPCFELWLLLYHVEEDEVKTLVDASAVVEELRSQLGEYNKNTPERDAFSN